MAEHFVIFDTQVRSGVPTHHLKAAGNLIMKNRPDVVVVIGDWWDFPALSSYTGAQRLGYDRHSYMEDLKAGKEAMAEMLAPLNKYNKKQKKNKKKGYHPRLVFTLGNHEDRVDRLIEDQLILTGALPRCEDFLRETGFEVYPFKQPVEIDGVNYCHLCPQTKSAGAVERAHLILNKRHASWTVGHSQIIDMFISPHEPRLQGIICGSSYLHDETYKKGSNDHWRGVIYKRHVAGGVYDPELISLGNLIKDYGV